MLASKLVIYVANPQYAPAQHFFTLLASSQSFHVRGLKTPNAVVLPPISETIEWSSADLISGQNVEDIFEECEAAFMFIKPSDLSQVSQLTRSFVEVASKTGVRRLAWVAPACSKTSDEGAHLAEAELSVRGSWIGRRLATQLFFQDKPIPRWQVSFGSRSGRITDRGGI